MQSIVIYGLLNAKTGIIDYVGQTAEPKTRSRCYRGRQFIELARTSEEHANEVERLFFEIYRERGQASLNGARFCPYVFRPLDRATRKQREKSTRRTWAISTRSLST